MTPRFDAYQILRRERPDLFRRCVELGSLVELSQADRRLVAAAVEATAMEIVASLLTLQDARPVVTIDHAAGPHRIRSTGGA